ncbi:MAG: TetR/AcrR family transcriptional regulator [Desulfobacterales bacterium]|nr:TetR/AcrR family transcriptional regulator [Desulfobacterales bacterium]
MKKHEKDTKQEILNIAEELILTKGYTNFSYKDISETIGIRRASIHHHYPTKEDLGSAFVQKYQIQFKIWCDLTKDKSPKEKFEEFLELYKLLSNNFQKACPIGMLITEYIVLPQKLQIEIKNFFSTIVSWLSDVLEEGKKQKEFKSEINPIVFANIIVILLSGTLKTALVFEDCCHCNSIFEEVKNMIISK